MVNEIHRVRESNYKTVPGRHPLCHNDEDDDDHHHGMKIISKVYT